MDFVHHINTNKDARPKMRVPAGITEGWKYILTLTNGIEFQLELELAGYLRDSKAHRKMMQGENFTSSRDGTMQ